MLLPARKTLNAYGKTGFLSTISGVIALMLAANRPAQSIRPAVLGTPVVTATAGRGTIERTVTIGGIIRAASETQLGARMPARVRPWPPPEQSTSAP